MFRTISTASFRLSVFFAGIFVFCFTILVLIVYFSATAAMRDQLRSSIEDDSAALVADATKEGVTSIIDDVNERLQKPQGINKYYYLRDPSRRKLAGNLNPPVTIQGWHEGPFTSALIADGSLVGDTEHQLWGTGATIRDGSYLFVGQDAFPLISTQEAILQSLVWSTAAAFLIAIAAGMFASHRFLARIDAINTTSLAILNGRLRERIPIKGTSDEMDLLSANLNRLFDSNETLLESLKQVTTNIAHDLRSPLTRLRQVLDSARVEGRPTEVYLAAIETAIEEADNLLSTFAGLLRIAQIESGSRKKGFQPVQLSEVVERVARAYQPVAEDASKELTTVIEPDLHIIGDRDLLTQMLANLVENSIRHTPAQTRISVRARSERNAIIVEVADSGTGIPAAERERVFERFYRLDASRRTPGNGLGLSLVAAVAALHDAETELQDNSPGLLVVLKLPLPGPTAASAVSSLRQSGGMERVVRVSDL